MLFRKKIEPRCSYCARGGRANDHEVICAKKGIVPAESHCGAFRYDPLKRVPPRPAKLETEELRKVGKKRKEEEQEKEKKKGYETLMLSLAIQLYTMLPGFLHESQTIS